MALSTIESECIALSQSLCDTIPIIQLMWKMKERSYNVCSTAPKVTFKVFEDNEGAMELARFPKMRPSRKHANQMCHHFRSYVFSGDAEMFHIDTKVKIGEMFTKPLQNEQCLKLRLKFMGF